MANYCEDCGCKVCDWHCVNCHEEIHIYNQYVEQDMAEPSKEFMDKVIEQTYNPSNTISSTTK